MRPTVLAGGSGLTSWLVFVAWYDYDLKGYQKERVDTELERVFEEKIDSDRSILHESKFGEYMAKPLDKTEETEWQKLARQKKAGEKIKEVRGRATFGSLMADECFTECTDITVITFI